MSDSEAARPGGLFDRVGNFVIRFPWLVIAFWIALAAVPALTLPPLMEAAAKNQTPALPDDSPTMTVAKQMSKDFGETGKGSQLLMVLTDENGLSPADFDAYAKLVGKLHDEKLQVQDFISTPPLKEILVSKDNKAWILPINFNTDVTDPATVNEYVKILAITKETLASSTLTARYAGALASITDLNFIGQEDAHLIEIGTAASVLLILFMIYRNVVAMFVPLVTIGLSVATAQGILSGCSELGLDIQTQTIVFMTAVMIGGGTDYAVFLISRYHDFVRRGLDSDQAVKNAMMSIGKVIAASAATVAVTFLAMYFAKLSLFSSIGPAISISIIIAFVAAISLLPAILVLIGRRGWINPRRDLTRQFWRRTGVRVVRRPKMHLAASLVVLMALASCSALVRFNYDDLKALPSSAPSVAGYNAMNQHFPPNIMTPMVLLVESPRDLRTPAALADLEAMVSRVSQLPNIIAIRGLTRPTGEPLQQTKMSFQAGEVGGKLDEASTAINQHGDDLDKLTGGSRQLADALAQVRDQVIQAMAGAGTLITTLNNMKQVMGADKTLGDLDNSSKLVDRMRALGDALNANMVDVSNTVAWATPLMNALNSSPVCDGDPSCVASRAQLRAIVQAGDNGTLASISALAHNLQDTQGLQTLSHTVAQLQQYLDTAMNAVRSIDGLQGKLTQMQQGADALSEGSKAVADGVQVLVDQVKKMGIGLNEASSFLLGMKRDANRPSMAGFNIPPQVLTADEFKKAAQIFISPDGHAARYLVQSGLNSFTTGAMDQVNEILRSAQSAQPNTELSDASVAVAGVPSALRDTRDYFNDDIQFIVFATVMIVFFILVLLLRAIVAPLYLIGSVLISFLSALGIGVVVFQLILGMDLHWSLPGLSFILLVAVGADYNMLLISRIRDESPHGVRVGVIRTVASTGGVITSAGLIFAASMFGLLAASIATMLEAGFIIGTGILIDTFLVRSITVPAVAALIGQANWWPSKLGANAKPSRRVNRRFKVSGLGWVKGARSRKVSSAEVGGAEVGSAPLAVDESEGHPLPALSAAIPQGGVAGPHPPETDSDPVYDEVDGYPLPLFGAFAPLSSAVKLRKESSPAATHGAPHANGAPHTNGTSHASSNGHGNANGTDVVSDDFDDSQTHPASDTAVPLSSEHSSDEVDGRPSRLFSAVRFRRLGKANRVPAINGNGHANGNGNGATNGHGTADGDSAPAIDEDEALSLFSWRNS